MVAMAAAGASQMVSKIYWPERWHVYGVCSDVVRVKGVKWWRKARLGICGA
jgi:hypothetical protein